jgi:hypothetical protein
MNRTTKALAAAAMSITTMLTVGVAQVVIADAAVAGPKPCC